jgi:hypothetical protein
MKDRRREDRLYTAVLLAFLVGLVALGLLGIPALLVAAIGLVSATIAIVLMHGRRRQAPARYVPSVLEGSRLKRRRLVHLRRHRHPASPLRFR